MASPNTSCGSRHASIPCAAKCCWNREPTASTPGLSYEPESIFTTSRNRSIIDCFCDAIHSVICASLLAGMVFPLQRFLQCHLLRCHGGSVVRQFRLPHHHPRDRLANHHRGEMSIGPAI